MTGRELDAIDVMFLLSCGISIEEALRRVSWKPEAASRWAERHRNTRLLDAPTFMWLGLAAAHTAAHHDVVAVAWLEGM